MISLSPVQRIRSFCLGVIGIAYYYAAGSVAGHAAAGLASADWYDVVERLALLFLLLLGLGALGYAFQRTPGNPGQRKAQPLNQLGLKKRPGWLREFALGAALGWGALVLSILPVVLTGGLVVTLWGAPRQWFLLALDVVILLALSLAEEIVFRGYALQRFVEAVGVSGAILLLAIFAAVLQFTDPFAPGAGVWVAFFFSWLLSLGFLRTQALWLPWGLRFAWYGSTSLVFGLPINGISRYTPVVQSTTHGPEWLTGGEYGPQASLTAILVMLAAIVVLLRVTREYVYRYATPAIVAAGIPVDIDAIARQQHEAGMGMAAEPSSPSLIQIGGQTTHVAVLQRAADEQNSEADATQDHLP